MKLVGITQRVLENSTYPERRDALAQDWQKFLFPAGLVGLPLPNFLDAAQALLETVPLSGLILSGGNDVREMGGDAPERDRLEHALLEDSKLNRLPVLGICRGLQMMVVHEGGQLQRSPGHAGTRHHLDNGREVNSYHDCVIASLPDGFSVLSSVNGQPESVCHRQHNWTGIMWHPERESSPDPVDLALFREVFGS